MFKVIEIAFKGLPESKYSVDYSCPKCGIYYTDYKKIDVCYFELPEPATNAGIIPKDGAVEINCPCGTIWWCHIDIKNRDVRDNETIVPPYRPVETGDKKRGKHCQDTCEHEECKFEGGGKCNFGGWNAGMGCFLLMAEGEFDSLVGVMIGSQTTRDVLKYHKRKEVEHE